MMLSWDTSRTRKFIPITFHNLSVVEVANLSIVSMSTALTARETVSRFHSIYLAAGVVAAPARGETILVLVLYGLKLIKTQKKKKKRRKEKKKRIIFSLKGFYPPKKKCEEEGWRNDEERRKGMVGRYGLDRSGRGYRK
ncbi:hypothetical protein EDB82DRAFT_127036 [Fusarium venenatum]|uniref:uncharacterized protein n=1 Tax=Fusarium venenatum TaxID=56646 RepID=UPI001D38EA5A|nr:hypothetical protein EDB82DRAFT_127036 [Fusarium venenatum]